MELDFSRRATANTAPGPGSHKLRAAGMICRIILFMVNKIHPPRHLVWSTNDVDLDDPFQRRWLLQQTLINGTADDIRQLDLDEIREQFDQLLLPADVESFWRAYLKHRYG